MKKNRTFFYIKTLLAIILAVALDQYTKYLAVIYLKNKPSIPLIQGVFELEYLENRGAAFGLFENQQWFFLLFGLLLILVVLYFYTKMPADKRYLPLKICSVFIISGALGNMIDRFHLSYVVDFFYFSLIDFPIFNVADIYVTVSVFALMILVLFYYKDNELEGLFSRTGRRRR
ncbi:signal peptidase II [Lachnoclostridium sp. An181]|uniref:signal peptidase II n=1 Tax=Lachnoclostridium sp. An181 TaxID=1965575 RepID=UPI000B381A54|nr:signal peptidase II [Lachnoclostridium sp. An181]OUP50847.1 signal peptidase II [Lachnoclostridium sp. An181]